MRNGRAAALPVAGSMFASAACGGCGGGRTRGSQIGMSVAAQEELDLEGWRLSQVSFAKTIVPDPGDCAVRLIGENWSVSVGECRIPAFHASLLTTAEALTKMLGGSVSEITQ
jgi:hypothetical protein